MTQTEPQTQAPKLPKLQTIIDIGGTIYTVNRKYTGTKTLDELYEDFLKRKVQNIR